MSPLAQISLGSALLLLCALIHILCFTTLLSAFQNWRSTVGHWIFRSDFRTVVFAILAILTSPIFFWLRSKGCPAAISAIAIVAGILLIGLIAVYNMLRSGSPFSFQPKSQRAVLQQAAAGRPAAPRAQTKRRGGKKGPPPGRRRKGRKR